MGLVEAAAIDRINIYQATLAGHAPAVGQLRPVPELLLLDGNARLSRCVPQRTIVGGDASCACIAAASILAKVTRDRIMLELDARYPGYGFAQHKGYGTPEHLAQLHALGPCPEHRRSFAPVPAACQPDLPLD